MTFPPAYQEPTPFGANIGGTGESTVMIFWRCIHDFLNPIRARSFSKRALKT